MCDTSLKILNELNNIENHLRNKTNQNILNRFGLNEMIDDFQKPVVNKLENIDKTIKDTNSIMCENVGEKLDNLQKIRKIFEVELATEWRNNLSKTVIPRMKGIAGDGGTALVINNVELPIDYSPRTGILKIKIAEDLSIVLTNELRKLLQGASFNGFNNTDLKAYWNILNSAGVTTRTPRFRELNNIINPRMSSGSRSIRSRSEDLSTNNTEGLLLATHSPSNTLADSESIPGDISIGEGMKVVPLDLTGKSPIDLFIEVNKLKLAKNAGNNNTLARANVILDRLLKLKLINKNKYMKKLKYFSQ